MSRQHSVTIDVGVWDGGDGYDYRLTITIDEHRLRSSPAVARALCREGTTDLAGGGIVVQARRISEVDMPLFGDEPHEVRHA
jgi:hypothetical protein